MIEPLIVALNKIKPDLTSEQIADILWLAMQRQQIVGIPNGQETKPLESKPPETKPPESKPPETKPPESKPPESEQRVSVYPKTAEQDKDNRPIRVVDVPSLRQPLPLTRALKSLMKRVPFGEPVL